MSCPGLLTKGQGSAHVDVESIITPQEEPLVVSELGQNDDTTRGQGSVHVKSIITPQGEGPELGQNNDTTRGQGSARVESMTSQGEQLAMCTIHTITPGNYKWGKTWYSTQTLKGGLDHLYYVIPIRSN